MEARMVTVKGEIIDLRDKAKAGSASSSACKNN
jgi:hypothetical protein